MDLTDEPWSAIDPFFPEDERHRPGPHGGRSYRDPRDVFDAVWFVRCGRLATRWEVRVGKFEDFVHLACLQVLSRTS